MKRLLPRIIKFLVYSGAAIVVLVAVAIGLFRLMLPRLPEYQEEIKEWASTAIGSQVEFTNMNARWRMSGPELNFYDAEVSRSEQQGVLLEADEVTISVGLMRLLTERRLVVDRILVRGTEVTVGRDQDGHWRFQGLMPSEFPGFGGRAAPTGALAFVGQDISIRYQVPDSVETVPLEIETLTVRHDARTVDIRAEIGLPKDLGQRVEVSANRFPDDEHNRDDTWEVFVDGSSLKLPGWSRLKLEEIPDFLSGSGNVSVRLRSTTTGIRSATADVEVRDLSVRDQHSDKSFDLTGRVEYTQSLDKWRVVADKLAFATPNGEWPETAIRIEADMEPDGEISLVTATASFVDLDDIGVVMPWLTETQRSLATDLAPSGIVRDLDLTIAVPGGDDGRFELSARLAATGVAPFAGWPGIRGVTGHIRADRSGGRLESASTDLRLLIPRYSDSEMKFDDASGAVVWRRSNGATTILTDSLRLRNSDLNSTTSLQLSVPADGGVPEIDLGSEWSINDLSVTPAYLPAKLMKPKLYRWLDDALVAGSIPRGTIKLTGPLDQFPFDGGEGELIVKAAIDNATLQYSPKWPAAELKTMDLVVDKMRLYSHKNTAQNAGNSVVNAKIEIADLRKPVLTIDALATGTLGSILGLVRRSPIADVFGGKIDTVEVDGDASFDLSLNIPIGKWRDYSFTTRMRSNGGSVKLRGVEPTLTNLSGAVDISRDDIRTDALVGRFLGEPVDIAITKAPADMPSFSVLADVRGRASAQALINELGVPLANRLSGSTDYLAKLKFPKAGLTPAAHFEMAVESTLEGLTLDLPEPLHKSAAISKPMTIKFAFAADDRLNATGRFNDDLRWSLQFAKQEASWSFDRGVVRLGGGDPLMAGDMGLYIEGRLPNLRLQEWLDVARVSTNGGGIGQHVESVDLFVDRLNFTGQEWINHRMRLKRGSNGWQVQSEGDHLEGSVFVPYDFAGNRPLILEMQKLHLPGGDEAATAVRQADPRDFPPISIKASDFALGERNFGKIDVEFVRSAGGLESTTLHAEDDSFSLDGGARWVVDPADETGSRSFLAGKLVSNDVGQSLQRWSYAPVIDSQDMEIDFDLNWSGGPRKDYLDSLRGDFSVRFGSGQLDDLDPGAGRVFGLLSVVALPRRLSLDFSDVFKKGFGFDEISGHFRVIEGDSYTCDLSLKGPAADIGIVGHTNLGTREYRQSAVISASVGDTLPLVGAIVATPQVGAALLVFSRIFKKPLKDIGQVFYSIDGPWENPVIEQADAAWFASTSELADCVPSAN